MSDTPQDKGAPRPRYSFFRLLSLTLALVLVAATPFLNRNGIGVIQGWFQSLSIGHLWFVSPLEGLESLLVTRTLYVPTLVAMLVPVVLALCLGRVFCSWICPISFFAEWLERIRRALARRKRLRDRLVLTRRLLWFALIGELLLTMILGAPIFVFTSPPGLVGREMMQWVFFGRLAPEGMILVAVLILELVTRRFYCRYFCPLGALLALVAIRRRLVITLREEDCVQCGRCDQLCPLGLRPSLGEAAGPYCWNCGACVQGCRPAALDFSWRSPR